MRIARCAVTSPRVPEGPTLEESASGESCGPPGATAVATAIRVTRAPDIRAALLTLSCTSPTGSAEEAVAAIGAE